MNSFITLPCAYITPELPSQLIDLILLEGQFRLLANTCIQKIFRKFNLFVLSTSLIVFIKTCTARECRILFPMDFKEYVSLRP